MTDFTLSLAGVPIRVEALLESTASYCQDYFTSEAPALHVVVTQADIEYERVKALQADASRRSCSVVQLERFALYRKISAALLERDILLMHGAVLALGGRAYLFTAPSGTGKTTHCRLWLSQFSQAHVLNGDKPLLRVEKDRVLACGTPWQGKERIGRNEILPLSAICLLARDSVNHVEAVSLHDALPTLIAQTNRPADPQALMHTLELLGRIGGMTRLYRLGCNMEPEAAQISFHALCEGETP